VSLTHVALDQLGPALAARLRGFKPRVEKAIRVVIATRAPLIMIQVTNEARPRPPVNTGAHRAQWRVGHVPGGATYYNMAAYAGVLDKGRRPGGRMPPVDAIEKWVKRKMAGEIKAARADTRELFRGADRETRRHAKYHAAAQEDATIRRIAFLIARKIAARGWPFAPNQPMELTEKIMLQVIPLVKQAMHQILFDPQAFT